MPAAVGSAWSDDAAAKLIAAVAEGEPDQELTKRVRAVVDDAITKSAGGGTFGGVSSFSSTSSSSGFSFGTRRARVHRDGFIIELHGQRDAGGADRPCAGRTGWC